MLRTDIAIVILFTPGRPILFDRLKHAPPQKKRNALSPRGVPLDLSVDRHVSRVCAGCFYRFRHLRRIRQSLDSDSLATLIYAVVNSRMDYCNTVLDGAPRTLVTDKLQRVLNAAARVITGTRKFDRCVGQILHDQLHWLDVPDRVLFKLAVTVH